MLSHVKSGWVEEMGVVAERDRVGVLVEGAVEVIVEARPRLKRRWRICAAFWESLRSIVVVVGYRNR